MNSVAPSLGFRDMTLAALGAGMVVALGATPPIPLGILPVPITLQTFGVMLAGLVLGPRRAVTAMLVFVALVALGLPVLAGGRGGLGVLVGPSAGYLYGWIPAAFVVGGLARRFERIGNPLVRGASDVAACLLGGVIIVHACGVVWLSLVTGLGWWTALSGTLLFAPGDIVKAILAAVVCRRIETFITLDRR
ncbi:biotin transporter BioY [Azospirillum sp. TSO35-2]|uniref:biotin transporter BioY n=1 Tax=Azospirillum sp. TSO35-2 TaxID=716796 RepID=UPI000D61338D|nr:biotin transporter BioY [Azospirillum sp. TSO35-2]PWC36044.1 biotin biosynthesis protein BioC [Azospirillum sp. TSO35-2]